MKKKKQDITKTICIISTSRADFGLLLSLAEEIVLQKNLKLNFITTFNGGSDDSISSKIKIETLRTRESLRFNKSSNIKFIGSLLTNLNKKFDKIKPDIVFILGDRFEVLSIAQLCCLRKIPIAHISGGEITEGSLQDPMLRSKLKDALRAEIEAELKSTLNALDEEVVEKPKKKKKVEVEVSDEAPEVTPKEKPWFDPTT